MNRKNKQVAAQIIPVLREVFGEQRSSDSPGMAFQFGDRGWSLTPEESQSFHGAVLTLATAFPRIHRKTCEHELERFCCEQIPKHGAAFEDAIPEFLGHLSSLGNIENVVYVEISGLRLEVAEVSVGSVRLISSEHPDVDEHRLMIKDINGNYPAPIDPNLPLARVEVCGESQFAKEIATAQAQTALDCLQVLSIQENRAAFGDNFGFVLACSGPMPLICCRRWMFSSLQPTWSYDKSCGPVIATDNPQLNLPINTGTLSKLNARGLVHASELLADPSPSPFDEGLLAALKWIASAIRERDFTRKYLSFHIALEALFARDDSAIRNSSGFASPATPVDDGVAFLLGKTVDSRIRIAQRIRELSRTRNMIVHRGYSSVERNDLLTLAGYSWNCCMQALKMRGQFRDENSFREWCLRQKYGTPQRDMENADKVISNDKQ